MSNSIAAISTALGEGGIGIVRVSGNESLGVMRKLMLNCPKNIKERHTYMSKVIDEKKEIIDDAIFIYFKSPASYTGEDMLEIQAHGSNVSLKKILHEILKFKNIRMAEPGEFTKLAFLNGKMNLSQAEAVISIIKAKSDFSLEIANSQLEGNLSKSINKIRDNLLNILAKMAVNIDYPDEDIENTVLEELINDLRWISSDVDDLLDTSKIGKIAREGIKIAIVGKPNVGKSSLMNALLGEGRVIVTDIPGTTRDTVEENATLGGIPIVLVDTAGLRETTDKVEKIGIERTERAIAASDLVLLVIDGSSELENQDDKIISFVKKINGDKILVVINKDDLGKTVDEEKISKIIPNCKVITTSLIDKYVEEAASKVSRAIGEIIDLGDVHAIESNIVSDERHIKLLREAQDNLSDAINLINNQEPFEVIELSTRYAYETLGKIIGEEVGEEIIDAVFSKFCLGK